MNDAALTSMANSFERIATAHEKIAASVAKIEPALDVVNMIVEQAMNEIAKEAFDSAMANLRAKMAEKPAGNA